MKLPRNERLLFLVVGIILGGLALAQLAYAQDVVVAPAPTSTPTLQDNLITILGALIGAIALWAGTWGAILNARVKKWSEAKLAENGLKEAAKWQADLKAGLLTGAKAALLEGKSITEAIKAAITHTLASNADAAAGLQPQKDVLERLATAAVADAAAGLAATAANAVKAGAAAGPALDELTTVLHRALDGAGSR